MAQAKILDLGEIVCRGVTPIAFSATQGAGCGPKIIVSDVGDPSVGPYRTPIEVRLRDRWGRLLKRRGSPVMLSGTGQLKLSVMLMLKGSKQRVEKRPCLLQRNPAGVQGPAGPVDMGLLPAHPGVDLLTNDEWVRVAGHVHLSARESCVAILIFEGKTRFQVARELNCASGSVRVYIDRLFAKLNVQDRVGMVLRVVRIHLEMSLLAADAALSHKSATSIAACPR